MNSGDIFDLIHGSVPFIFLSSGQMKQLIHNVEVIVRGKGSVVLEPNFTERADLYFVLTGLIKTYTTPPAGPHMPHMIKPGHFFGEQFLVLGQSYNYGFMADRDETEIAVISGSLCRDLLKKNRGFAQALGTILRDDQGVFAPFEKFSIEVIRGVNQGEIDINRLLPFYQALSPALHPGAASESIDFPALFYAVNRLPDNVSTTFAYLLTDDLPTEFSTPDQLFRQINSSARRRNVWEIMPGKNMVLIRSGLSDLMDIITNLCIYSVEVRKIRFRLHDPQKILLLDAYLHTGEHLDEKKFLATLGFSQEEIEGLLSIWPENLIDILTRIVRHREVISISIRRQIHNYRSRRMELWTRQVGMATRKLLGAEPSDLGEKIEIHVISSNSHSVTNCLNPAIIRRKDEIIEWAKKLKHPVLKETWKNEFDLVYALSRIFLKRPENMSNSTAGQEESFGTIHLKETASTGIQVQLIDTRMLRGQPIDPGISPIPGDRHIIIVNIDYAFGEQAEDIIRNLIMLFHRNLKSINIIGKAGALVGKRGDILIPESFIEQTSDRFFPVENDILSPLSGKHNRKASNQCHRGPMLTVAGTLLQNPMMLNFYHNLWGCIGIEMEGVYYFRQILESRQLDVIPDTIPVRFLYYISDLPLNTSANLAAPLKLSEGVPPLYSITRIIISSIFDQDPRP